MINKINLPYSLDALEPYYSKETLAIHYETLYTGYVNNTNKTEEKRTMGVSPLISWPEQVKTHLTESGIEDGIIVNK